MSWFRKKNATQPSPSSQPSEAELEARIRDNERTFNEDVNRWVTTLKAHFESLLNQREAELRSLGLPVPQISGQLTYECTHGRLVLLFSPRPLIPPYFVVYCRSDAAPSVATFADSAAYVITGTAEIIEAAKQTYKQQGISALRKAYPGVWLNQDPYEIYGTLERNAKKLEHGSISASNLNESGLSSVLWEVLGGSVSRQTLQFHRPIHQLRDYTAEDLRQFERRLTRVCHARCLDTETFLTLPVKFGVIPSSRQRTRGIT